MCASGRVCAYVCACMWARQCTPTWSRMSPGRSAGVLLKSLALIRSTWQEYMARLAATQSCASGGSVWCSTQPRSQAQVAGAFGAARSHTVMHKWLEHIARHAASHVARHAASQLYASGGSVWRGKQPHSHAQEAGAYGAARSHTVMHKWRLQSVNCSADRRRSNSSLFPASLYW